MTFFTLRLFVTQKLSFLRPHLKLKPFYCVQETHLCFCPVMPLKGTIGWEKSLRERLRLLPTLMTKGDICGMRLYYICACVCVCVIYYTLHICIQWRGDQLGFDNPNQCQQPQPHQVERVKDCGSVPDLWKLNWKVIWFSHKHLTRLYYSAWAFTNRKKGRKT